MENNLKKNIYMCVYVCVYIYTYIYNWITLMYTWNNVSQLTSIYLFIFKSTYFNLRKKKFKGSLLSVLFMSVSYGGGQAPWRAGTMSISCIYAGHLVQFQEYQRHICQKEERKEGSKSEEVHGSSGGPTEDFMYQQKIQWLRHQSLYHWTVGGANTTTKMSFCCSHLSLLSLCFL